MRLLFKKGMNDGRTGSSPALILNGNPEYNKAPGGYPVRCDSTRADQRRLCAGAHPVEEWVDLESVRACAEVYRATALEFCG
jgi:hypothetical protein